MSGQYVNIEDETFPSFLAESINSNLGDALENCTLTSNLGLPVAASTVAKARTAFERLPDVQASYLENEQLPVSTDNSSNSAGEQHGKFVLSFKDDLEDLQTFIGAVNGKNQMKTPLLPDRSLKESVTQCVEFLPSGLKDDFSSVNGRTSESNSNEKFTDLLPKEKVFPGEDIGSSVESFLANEKLMSIASLDGSSSDEELNDEEFCDEELEAYFKNLQPPGMQRGIVEGQEIQEPKRTTYMEDFQMLQVRLAATGMDSAPGSDDDDVELQLERGASQTLQRDCFRNNSARHLIGEQHRPSFRPGLEGGSSEEDLSDVLRVPNDCASSSRQSAEGHGIWSPRASLVDLFGFGDGSSGTDEYLSPTYSQHEENTLESSDVRPSSQTQTFQFSFANDGCEKGSAQHSVVYQNEEGKWVTDLAYYKSFENEHAGKFSGAVTDQFNEEDFIVGSHALEMLDQDQEEFEKEHRFIQEEKMDLENVSLNLGDTSWKMPASALFKSQVASDLCQEDASYLRLSLGEFFGQRSEALGCLGGGMDVKRPSFGYHIISPEKQEPVALLRESEISRNSEHDSTIKFCDDTLTPEDLGSLPDNKTLASATFDVRTQGEIKYSDTRVGEQRKEKLTSNIEGQHLSKERNSDPKCSQTPDVTLLNISTIASAIANASCSADPTQLAAMLLALSNKKNLGNALLDSSGYNQMISRLLQASIKDSSPESFVDLEKYLKPNFSYSQDSENESYEHSAKDFTWDMSLGFKQTLTDSTQDFANVTDVHKPDLRKPDNFKEVQVGCVKPLPVGKFSNTSGNSGMTTSLLDSAESDHIAVGSNKVMLENKKTGKQSSNSLASNRHSNEVADLKSVGQTVNIVSQKGSESLKPCLQDSTKLKSPRKSACRLASFSAGFKEPYNVREEVSQKHVSFQSSPGDMQPKVNGIKPFAEYAVHAVDEEQYSFRPSTSPLIHSSPSQDSLKLSDSSNSPQKQAAVQKCDHSLDESSSLSASLSRLTYVSAMENTLQNSVHSPDKKKSNNTIELSTTIVRASPTPSEMQLVQSDPFSQDHRNLETKLSRSPSGFRVVSTSGVTYKAENSKENKIELHPSSISTKDSIPFSWQEYTTKSSQELPSANISAPIEMYAAVQNIPVSQCACVPGFKPGLQANEAHILPSVPTLLTGQSLSSTPFAQQYLGSVNPLPAYSGVNSALPGAPMGYSSCTFQTQNFQNKVNANLAAGLLAQLPITNHTTSGQCFEHFHLPENQSGTTGLSQWTSSRLSSGFGQVLVPEEVTFPGACCVGIASQTSLNIFNPNERWMQVNIGVLSISINGEKVDAGAHQCLVFKNKTIIGPRATEDIKILLLPQRPGLFQCILNVSSWPVSADTETIVRAETIASKVLLATISEYPVIEVDTGKSEGLDFGELSSGNWKSLPLKLVNRTRATVPIRLIISANASAWRCFTFSKDPTNLVKEFAVHSDPVSKMSSPSVISHVLHASYDGQDPEYFVIWVVFHAPQTYNSAGSLGPPEDFVARVDIEMDSPGPACVLKSVPLHARAGCVRIHAPKDLQTMHLTCSAGSTAKQMLPLKNAGNIAAHLKVKCTNEEGFSVDPEDLFLNSGEEQVVAVKYSPQYAKSKQSILKIMVQPSGPQYEVTLVGKTEAPVNTNPASKGCSDAPPILSNKQFMSWGGVGVGRAVQQKLTLRNTSGTIGQHLRLIIRGQDQDCFQLQSMFGSEERLTSTRELTLRPKEDATVLLMFSPTRVGCMLAKLEIKQSGSRPSLPGIKFTIPLAGYGGTSNIILEDLKKLSDSYLVTLNSASPGRVSKASFSVRNTGSRAAYVKAACFANFEKSVVMDPNVMCVSPDKFVLKQDAQEMVTISYIASNAEPCNQLNNLICMVCFLYGDEVSRQQFRRAVLRKPEAAQKIIAEYSKLKNTRFDEEFPGEQLISEVYDLPERPNDIQLFFGSMRRIVLSVVGSTNVNTVGTSIQYSMSTGLDSSPENMGRSVSNQSLDVLPVKGPQGPLLSNTSAPSRVNGRPEHTWTVKPECLLLAAPTAVRKKINRLMLSNSVLDDIAGTGQIQIYNHSSRLLEFDLSWPAHWLTVTPQHGNIEPQKHKIILVSPNPSVSTKQTLLPWNGQIYLHCDNEQKIVKVQISDGVLSGPGNAGRKSLPLLTPHLDTPVHVAKPLPKPQSAVIEIKNRTIVFPKTAARETSENFLDLENPSDEDIKWLLSSFAPPYVKGVDQSDDIYRATYTAFRCSQTSGFLAAHSKIKVSFSFLPTDRGDYTQFWDLECHPVSEPNMKHKVRIQLCGESVSSERVPFGQSANSIAKTEVPVMPRRRCGSEASSYKVQDATVRGVFASDEVYTFPPTFVGESSTLKVNLKNNTFTTYMLKFVSPKEPFHMKHSKYSLRAHHYINLPVKFKPSIVGKFEDSLVVQTDAENICIQLVGEALAN
ncbi:centrosomal protein of 192 kDa [Gastrophryne carolinensis]